MNIVEYFELLNLFESKITNGRSQLNNLSKEMIDSFSTRCLSAKIAIHNQTHPIDRIENSSCQCFTVALGSYILHVDAVFYLDIPDELQDCLFHFAILWINGNNEKRWQVEQGLVQAELEWHQWVTAVPSDCCIENI